MEETILISYLNDFIFCPVSIYFHKLYGKLDKKLYQSEYQINGTNAHKAIDNKKYNVKLPADDNDMNTKFEDLIKEIHEFDIENFKQTKKKKCKKCIYEPACDRSLIC